MKKKEPLSLYRKYHTDRDDSRIGLFVALEQKYLVKEVLYPGSFVHITPSLVFPKVVYVDSFEKTEEFFANEEVYQFINDNKMYSQSPTVVFHKSDYSNDFGEKRNYFDLLISQYAGFISQKCKKYLKVGGILVANDSHGDASMAFLDSHYKFISVYNRENDTKYTISDENLNAYFVSKSGVSITKIQLAETQRGVKYTNSATGYIFKKIK